MNIYKYSQHANKLPSEGQALHPVKGFLQAVQPHRTRNAEMSGASAAEQRAGCDQDMGPFQERLTEVLGAEAGFLNAGEEVEGALGPYQTEVGDLLHPVRRVENAVPVGQNVFLTNGLPDPKLGMPTIREVFEKYFMKEGKPLVDVIVNVMKFSFTTSGSISIKALEEMGVPVLEAYSLIAPKEEWEASPEGMNAMEISISVTMPEFDGIIHGMPIAAKHVKEDGEVEYLPIPERMRAMVSRAGAWARLHRKPNAEKKIAIIFHNYPPKNSNIGSAYGLDSIESSAS